MNCKTCKHRFEDPVTFKLCGTCRVYGIGTNHEYDDKPIDAEKAFQKDRIEHERHMKVVDKFVYALAGFSLGYVIVQLVRAGAYGPKASAWVEEVLRFWGVV